MAGIAGALQAVGGGTVAFAAAFVLLGAPLMADVQWTVGMALWLGCLTCLPGFLVVGSCRTDDWHRVLFRAEWRSKAERGFALYARVVLAAAWASAALIPLDWDVWYQRWPTPCFFGSLFSLPVAVAACLVSFRASLVVKRA
ncbi:Glycosylphosphatidylinositol anchor biosynthesis protein 11 [Diplonema papillatum]|nr:Glycosylphosphatidylinositol anchor biosynthesis protein 11 [Diplonema papillatum]